MNKVILFSWQCTWKVQCTESGWYITHIWYSFVLEGPLGPGIWRGGGEPEHIHRSMICYISAICYNLLIFNTPKEIRFRQYKTQNVWNGILGSIILKYWKALIIIVLSLFISTLLYCIFHFPLFCYFQHLCMWYWSCLDKIDNKCSSTCRMQWIIFLQSCGTFFESLFKGTVSRDYLFCFSFMSLALLCLWKTKLKVVWLQNSLLNLAKHEISMKFVCILRKNCWFWRSFREYPTSNC